MAPSMLVDVDASPSSPATRHLEHPDHRPVRARCEQPGGRRRRLLKETAFEPRPLRPGNRTPRHRRRRPESPFSLIGTRALEFPRHARAYPHARRDSSAGRGTLTEHHGVPGRVPLLKKAPQIAGERGRFSAGALLLQPYCNPSQPREGRGPFAGNVVDAARPRW